MLRIRRTAWLLCAVCVSFCIAFFACAAPDSEGMTAELPQPTAAPVLTLRPTEAPTPTPVPTATPAPTPFSFVWMTDTQILSYDGHPALESMGRWIADHAESENILAVFHTGDLVDYGGHPWQWENFDRLLQPFYGKLPFYPVAGNHDLGVKRQNYDHYLPQYFVRDLPAEQTFADGAVYYDLFSAGGTEFILLGVGYEAAVHFDGVYDWIDTVLGQHPDHVGIVLLHRYTDGKGEIFPRSREIESRIVAANPNIRLVFCGHSSGISTRYDAYDDDGDGVADRTVCAMMYNIKDYQQVGYLRLLRVDPATRNIKIDTYSPYLDRYYSVDKSEELADFVVEKAF